MTEEMRSNLLNILHKIGDPRAAAVKRIENIRFAQEDPQHMWELMVVSRIECGTHRQRIVIELPDNGTFLIKSVEDIDYVKVQFESIEAYAMLNYLRDRTTLVDGEPLETESWKDVRDDYIEEAWADNDIVMTEDELMSMITAVEIGTCTQDA